MLKSQNEFKLSILEEAIQKTAFLPSDKPHHGVRYLRKFLLYDKRMKVTSLIASVALLGLVTVWGAPLKAINPHLVQASAQEIKIATSGETAQEKIDRLTAVKGKPGSGDLLRQLYVKDLTPIGIQPDGAGMIVNLCSKTDNTTISLCTTYDVIVAVKEGEITNFDPAEVK